MTIVSSMLGIDVGPLINTAEFDVVGMRANKALKVGPRRPWDLFLMGWTGLGYRARAAGEHLAAYRGSFPADRNASNEEHYLQDRELVEFIANAASAVEALLFATSVVTNTLVPGSFPDATEKMLRRNREPILKGLSTHLSSYPLPATLTARLGDADGVTLFEARDAVLHRGRLPRVMNVGSGAVQTLVPGNPKALPGDWTFSLAIEPTTLDDWAAWLTRTVHDAFRDYDPLLVALECALPAPAPSVAPPAGGSPP